MGHTTHSICSETAIKKENVPYVSYHPHQLADEGCLGAKEQERRTLEDQKLHRRKEREKKSKVKRQLTLVKKAVKARKKRRLSKTVTSAQPHISSDESKQDVVCPACSIMYKDPPTEDWILCCKCRNWWHGRCSNYEGHDVFTCDFC